MEIKTVITGQLTLEKMEEYKAMPVEMQRYLFYKGEIYGFSTTNRKETDTHVYWCNSNKVPRFENNRLFYLNSNKAGVSFDKEKKTIKIWFGNSIQMLEGTILPDILHFFKLDWFSAMSYSLRTLLNKTMLQNMIKGKITNPRDYIKAYLKTSPYKNLDISPEIFYKSFTINHAHSPKGFRKYILYATNPNEALEHVGKKSGNYNYNSTLEDLFIQAEMLNKKVNLKWSEARIKEVHAEWTRELMGMAIKTINPVEYNYPEIETPEGISLIKSNLELFEEGTTMKHCVYTNYERIVRSKEYYVFRYNREGVRATAGVRITGPDSIVLDQMYSIGNTVVDKEHKDYFTSWLYSNKSLELFRDGKKSRESITQLNDLWL
jgi:hypothetical protein